MSDTPLSGMGWRRAWARTLCIYALAVAVTSAAMLAAIEHAEQRVAGAATRARPPVTAANVLAGDDWIERIRTDEFWRAGRSRSNASEARSMPGARRAAGKQSQLSGGYRTVCVRLCDGSFFPVSHRTDAGSLARDAAQCELGCAASARLYVTSNAEDTIDQMVDLKGQPYTKLKTANLFRKAYDESCKCKPHAWEEAALNQHRIYALDVQLKKGNRAVLVELEQRKTKARLLAQAQKTAEAKANVAQARAAAAEQRRQLANAGAVVPDHGVTTASAAAAAPLGDVGKAATTTPLTGPPIPVSTAVAAMADGTGDQAGEPAISSPSPTAQRVRQRQAAAARDGIMRLGAADQARPRRQEAAAARGNKDWIGRAFQN